MRARRRGLAALCWPRVSIRRHRTTVLWLFLYVLAGGCGTVGRKPTTPASTQVAIVAPPNETPPPRPEGLYAADEALRDALSSPWGYLGTGTWPGTNRTQACVFRNARVFIVNVYCTISETNAFRVDIYSPERGRVRIYAEADGPISERRRREYFTFTVESEPAPGPEARLPPLSLTMSFEDLRAYEARRYDAFLPACYGGQALSRERGGCLGALAARASQWAERNRAFLQRASEDWYHLVREMRSRAALYGRELQ